MKLINKVVVRLALASFVASLLFCSGTAWAKGAAKTYLTRRQVLKNFFPTSERVDWVRKSLKSEQRALFRKAMGYRLKRDAIIFYIGKTGDSVDGYALIDNEMGKHAPITFAVRLDRDLKVREVTVMVYREEIGFQVRYSTFLNQFKGKTLADPIRLGRDIDAVSGATISSRSLAIGVKRTLWLAEHLLKPNPDNS